MTKANLPPIKIPATLLTNAAERVYFEAINFAIYQLFQRSGGGEDFFVDVLLRLDALEADVATLQAEVAQLIIDVDALEVAVAAILIRLNAIDLSITAIELRLDDLEGDVVDLKVDVAALELDVVELQQTFSWKTVPTGTEVIIGVNQQMIIADGITIDGTLTVDGELSLI